MRFPRLIFIVGHLRLIISKNRKQKVTIFLLAFSIIAAHCCFWLLPDMFMSWNDKVIDRLFLFRSASPSLQPVYDDTIVHVDLTDSTIQRLDNFYLNRSHHAKVIHNLANMGVSIQLYDFIFAAHSNPEEDQAILEATKEVATVYFGMAFHLSKTGGKGHKYNSSPERKRYLESSKWNVEVEGDSTSLLEGSMPLITFPALASASRGLGFLNIKFDRDGVSRRIPLLIRYDGAYFPSFSFRVLCDYLSVFPEKIVIRPGKNIVLRGALRPGVLEKQNITIPINRHGEMLINFAGPWERMKHYNFADILKASDDRDELEMWGEELNGKIVLVSEVITGSSDIGPVPTDAFFPLSGVHANVINTVLTESFLHELKREHKLLVELILLSIILILSLQYSSRYLSIGGALISIGYVTIVIVGFLYGNLVLPVIRPLIMILFAMGAILIYRYMQEENERKFIRSTFGRYLSNEVVEELLGSPEGLEMSGETCDVTFLVSDLRGFTALSESLPPGEVIDILNRYLKCMMDVITSYRGTVNEIEGDGILVFFGAPLSSENDSERAVACAIAMQQALVDVNKTQCKLNLPELAMGIGINSGEVVVGNIGSEKRSKYSAIGNPVNMTYRIESYTVGGQILISSNVYSKVKSTVQIQGNVEADFKGIKCTVTLYDVKGLAGAYGISLSDRSDDPLVDMNPPLPIRYFVMSKKVVSDEVMKGNITHLGRGSARIILDNEIKNYSNLKILIVSQDVDMPLEAYAKVLAIDNSDVNSNKTYARIEFTWLSEEVKAFLKKEYI